MGKFEIKIDKVGDLSKIQIAGVIDEDVDFSQHKLEGAAKLELDLGGIKSINSCGIREWIKWLGDAGQAPVTYFNCPKIIIDQVNMVKGFLPAQGKVASFYVPYYSEEAGSEENILFVHGKEFSDAGVNPPAEVKDKDGNVMEMDVVEDKYFRFLKKS